MAKSRSNPVAKFSPRYNKAKVFKDRKREEKKNPSHDNWRDSDEYIHFRS
jgi:hypothetical protein